MHPCRLTELTLSSSVLSSITVSGCPFIKIINIRSHALKVCCHLQIFLFFSIIPCINQWFILMINTSCILSIFLKLFLQKLVLQKQEKLTMLALECRCLQEVDLTGCKLLTDSIFEFLRGCPALRSLALDSCQVCPYNNYFYFLMSS